MSVRPATKNEGKPVPPVHLLVRLELPDRPPREFAYDFRQEVITIGRDPGNDIQIPLTTVSRRHSRIFYELGDYFLEDLGSTHGTTHNGKKLGQREKKLLRDGDQIAVMTFHVTFKTTTSTMLDRQPGEKTEALARRMVQEVLSSLGGSSMELPCLRVMDGPAEGKRLEIPEHQSEVTLGRSPECDFPLEDQNISRRHALVKRTWNGFTVQDLGSKNGVLVNGKRAEGAVAIKDGDEVQIGGVKMTFIDPASRILDQFGVLGDETAQPVEAQAPGEHADAEDPAEQPPDEGADPDMGFDAGIGDEAPVDDPPAYGEEGGGEEGIDGEGEAVEAPSPIETKGIGAEVVILIVGGLFLLTTIGAAVFLFL